MPDPTGSCGFPLAARKGEMSFLFRSEVTFYCPSALTLLQLTLPIQERSLSRHRKEASAGTGEEPQPLVIPYRMILSDRNSSWVPGHVGAPSSSAVISIR